MTFETAKTWIALYTRIMVNGKPRLPFNSPPEKVIAVPTDMDKLQSFHEFYTRLNFDWENTIKPYIACDMQILFQFQDKASNQKQFVSSLEFIRLNRIHINLIAQEEEKTIEAPIL